MAHDQLDPAYASRLLQRQDALQTATRHILADLKLVDLLASIGTPIQLGSSVLGLMTWPDIDFNVTCPGLHADHLLTTLYPLFVHARIKQVRYFNQTGPFTEGGLPYNERYYVALLYDLAGEDWKIDISCWLSPERTEAPGVIKAIQQQLTPETRLAILWIKDTWYPLPTYRTKVMSIDIYDAVLQHGVSTPDEFDAYLLAHDKPARTPEERARTA